MDISNKNILESSGVLRERASERNAPTNEQIVAEIRSGHSITDNLQLLYERNLPLIRQIIKPYTAYESEEDLLQEAFFGVVEAVNHYESSKNVLFMSYAVWWIRQSAIRYIEKCGSVVKIPAHKRSQINSYKKATLRFEQKNSRSATDTEIADIIHTPVETVGELKALAQGIASLDAPLPGMDKELTLVDTLKADLSVENSAVDKTYDEYSKNELWGIVERYTGSRENEIIKDIFVNGKTMAKIAREQGVDIERIRQIKEKGLRKLRIGRARRELMEKFEFSETSMYRGSWNNFKEHGTSIVEHIALKRLDAQEKYERHLRGIEEEFQKRKMRDDKIEALF